MDILEKNNVAVSDDQAMFRDGARNLERIGQDVLDGKIGDVKNAVSDEIKEQKLGGQPDKIIKVIKEMNSGTANFDLDGGRVKFCLKVHALKEVGYRMDDEWVIYCQSKAHTFYPLRWGYAGWEVSVKLEDIQHVSSETGAVTCTNLKVEGIKWSIETRLAAGLVSFMFLGCA